MPIVLLRVDERLIHGQVVIGWGNHLRPDRYLIVDEELSTSDWEQDLYRLAAGDLEVQFSTCAAARARIDELREAEERTIVLTRDIATMRCLAAGGLLRGERINLGGLRHGPGREAVLTYLHLSEDDRADLRALVDEGIRVSARDLPDTLRVSVETLLARTEARRGDGDA